MFLEEMSCKLKGSKSSKQRFQKERMRRKMEKRKGWLKDAFANSLRLMDIWYC